MEMGIEQILADVPREGEVKPDILGLESDAENEEQQEEKTPAESPTEDESEEESPTPDGENNQEEEKNLPFHLHPRWKAMNDERKQLRQTVEEMRAQIEQKLANTPQPPQSVPDRWKKLLGDNPEAFEVWRQEQEAWKQDVLQSIQQQQEFQRQQETEVLRQSESYVKDSLDELESEGLNFDRNELVKFMLDFKERYGSIPLDENNNIDFRKGYDLFSQFNVAKEQASKTKSNARKRIADFTTSDKSVSEPSEKPFLTSNDFRGKDWDTII